MNFGSEICMAFLKIACSLVGNKIGEAPRVRIEITTRLLIVTRIRKGVVGPGVGVKFPRT